MNFDPDDPLLTAYALGELGDDDARRAEFAALEADDPDAARAVAEIRGAASLLTAALRAEAAAAPGLATADRVAIEKKLGDPDPDFAAAPAAVAFVPRARAWWSPYVAAAALVLASGTLLVIADRNARRGDATAAIDLAQLDKAPQATSAPVAVFSEWPEAGGAPAAEVGAAPATEDESRARSRAMFGAMAPTSPADPQYKARYMGRSPMMAAAPAARPGSGPRQPADRRGGAMMGGMGGGGGMPADGAAMRGRFDSYAASKPAGGPAGPGQNQGLPRLYERGAVAPLDTRAKMGDRLARGEAQGDPAPSVRGLALGVEPAENAPNDFAFVPPPAPAAAAPGQAQAPASGPVMALAVIPAPARAAVDAPAAEPLAAPALAPPAEAMPEAKVEGFVEALADGEAVSELKAKVEAAKRDAVDALATAAADGKEVEELRKLATVAQKQIEDQIEQEVLLQREASREAYARIVENEFKSPVQEALSTFSIDVDTASYANVRRMINEGRLPPPDAVRIEELLNYFAYDYPQPEGADPFAVAMEVVRCPWNAGNRLVRIGIKGREMDSAKRPPSNLVFLVDVSGSMNESNKLPLVVEGLKMLAERLGENDKVAIVVYAGNEGLALASTRGDQKDAILGALDRLQAGGSTNGGAGIVLAYKLAQENFIKGGTNRVILCTDGDFNVGVTDDGSLTRLIEEKRKSGVFLSVLGFGTGNYQDAKMEQLADHGNGNYAYIDTPNEARKVLVEQMSGTLVTIAKDVKIQVEFNPSQVAGYRLIGYENRVLAKEDFNDDTKDAGEIGAGHTVTALYEIVPGGSPVPVVDVDDLKYQAPAKLLAEGEAARELLTVKLRFKAPDADTSVKREYPVTDAGRDYAEASADTKFAAAVAAYGMLLRGSKFAGSVTLAGVIELAEAGLGDDPNGYRREFVDLARRAKQLRGE